MKKLLIVISLISVCFAKESNQMQTKTKIKKNDNSCLNKSLKNNCAFNYCHRPNYLSSKNVGMFADFLFFNSHENIEYAYSLSDRNFKKTTNYEPGFRLGVYKATKENTFIYIDWTYIHEKSDSSVTSNQENILGSFLPPDFDNLMSKASANLKGDFNTLDIRLAKSYHISKYVISKPSFGVLAAFISQKMRANYFINDENTNVIIKNDYNGYGLISNYELGYLIGNNFSLFGSGSFSLLYGQLSSHQKSTSDVIDTLVYNIRNKFNKMLPYLNYSIGIKYSNYLRKHKTSIDYKIAYEFHNWGNISDLTKFYNIDPSAFSYVNQALSFNGFSFGLTANF